MKLDHESLQGLSIEELDIAMRPAWALYRHWAAETAKAEKKTRALKEFLEEGARLRESQVAVASPARAQWGLLLMGDPSDCMNSSAVVQQAVQQFGLSTDYPGRTWPGSRQECLYVRMVRGDTDQAERITRGITTLLPHMDPRNIVIAQEGDRGGTARQMQFWEDGRGRLVAGCATTDFPDIATTVRHVQEHYPYAKQ